jgi:hypothetical protein
MSDNTALLAFIDQLRGKGIRSFKGPFESGTIELELGPALIPDAPDEKPSTAVDSTKCHCGCFLYEHTNGLCTSMAGCDHEKCNPESA